VAAGWFLHDRLPNKKEFSLGKLKSLIRIKGGADSLREQVFAVAAD
jgi:hypothetical protein